jgi:hypothetical protein
VSRRVAPLAALALVALAAGAVSVRRVGEQVAVLEACGAAERGEWGDVLARTAGRTGPDATGLAAAECRCRALLATGAGEACLALLEALLADPRAGDWTPGPELAVHVIQTWRDAGHARDAAELARRAARRHPADPDLFYLELVTRSAFEDEEAVLRELAARIPTSGPEAARMRVSLAHRFLQRAEPARALAALGEAPPPDAREGTGRWFETQGMALASAGDLRGVERTYTAWREAGGDPAELFARFALALSLAGLESPVEPTPSLLRRALAAADAAGDESLHEALAIRLVLTLVNAGESREALAVYDRERLRHPLAGLAREELERSATRRGLARGAAAPPRGRVRFTAPAIRGGAELLLSPEPGEPVDAPYAALRLPPSGELVVERAQDEAPLRWLLRDARARTLASGTTHLAAGEERGVAIDPGPPRERAAHALRRRPADGRRRVAALLLDCADWRIAQYLRARGELPVLDALLAAGHRAVLTSEPPLTAAALDALVFPLRQPSRSFFGLAHQLGTELAGLASVGRNPLGGLAWLLPEAPDLFSVVGAGPRSAANLLFAHGGIRAGRHGEVTGPEGRRRRVRLGAAARDLSASERERFALLAAAVTPRDAIHLRTIAAEMDAAREIAAAREVDLLLLRVEPLDLLTHAHFADAVRDGQDDGERLLFEVYRYLDARIAEVDAELDADDVLVVMSDHGIRTAMEHSPLAIFVAVGSGVPAGRAPGEPDLRGVSRVLAELLGVATEWPDSGVAPFATRLAPASAAAEAAPPGRL